MLTLELLRLYKAQNPAKYLHKYGNRTPEEVMADPKLNNHSVSTNTFSGVTVEMKPKTEKELDFQPEAVVEASEEVKPAKGKKKKNVSENPAS